MRVELYSEWPKSKKNRMIRIFISEMPITIWMFIFNPFKETFKMFDLGFGIRRSPHGSDFDTQRLGYIYSLHIYGIFFCIEFSLCMKRLLIMLKNRLNFMMASSKPDLANKTELHCLMETAKSFLKTKSKK